MGGLDGDGDRRKGKGSPIITNVILCVRGGDALFPNDFGQDLILLFFG